MPLSGGPKRTAFARALRDIVASDITSCEFDAYFAGAVGAALS